MTNNHRKLTQIERLGLWFAPMFIKYRIIKKIFDEGHAMSCGYGESPSMFGINVMDSVSLQWKDSLNKDIYIERFPWWEFLLISGYIVLMLCFSFHSWRLWRLL